MADSIELFGRTEIRTLATKIFGNLIPGVFCCRTRDKDVGGSVEKLQIALNERGLSHECMKWDDAISSQTVISQCDPEGVVGVFVGRAWCLGDFLESFDTVAVPFDFRRHSRSGRGKKGATGFS